MAQGVQRLCFTRPIPDDSGDPSPRNPLALGQTKIGEYRLCLSRPWQNIVAGRTNYSHLAQEVNARYVLRSCRGSDNSAPFASKGRDIIHCMPPHGKKVLSTLVAPAQSSRVVLQG